MLPTKSSVIGYRAGEGFSTCAEPVRRLKAICLPTQTCNSIEITSDLLTVEEPELEEGNPNKSVF